MTQSAPAARTWLHRLVLGGVTIAVVGAGFLLIDLTLFRGRTPRIRGERAIASLVRLPINGAEQWVLIRGEDSTRPVVLFLHGGPGMPTMFLAHAFQAPLERHFVVVQWDRRGAGKSFDALGPADTPSVSGTLEDTWALTRYLRQRFHQDRIDLVGHSWGSYLGLLAVRGHPEYYRLYVGTGQMAGMREEVRAARRAALVPVAAARGDSTLLRRLADSTGNVSEDDLFAYGGELVGARSFWPILLTGLEAPEYTLADAMHVKAGADRVGRTMRNDVDPAPLAGDIAKIDIPVFFFLGRHDLNTPSALAARYDERLEAPVKLVVWYDRSAHFPFFEQPEDFAQDLARVHSLAQRYWSGGDDTARH